MIRLYRPSDAAAIRQIAFETADRGQSMTHMLDDRELIADVLVDYYRRYEPETLWVAESEDRVVGYLTGSLKSGQYRQRMAWNILPAAAGQAVARGLLWQRQSWRLARAGVDTWWRGGLGRDVDLKRYPAHLHINIKEGFRSQRLGHALVERFMAQAAGAGLRGVHAGVREDNVGACGFFKRMGFTALTRHPVVLPTRDSYQLHYTIIYGKTLI
ncbi:MAG: GNAT family N-acetyltransferase [Candidatus Omnitrophica bacterium]|nr:GNAT family N-acetyltransferase [Candidatus Omnitrophota bacterium]